MSPVAVRNLLSGIHIPQNISQIILLPLEDPDLLWAHGASLEGNKIHGNKILPLQSQNRALQCHDPQIFNNQFRF